ERGARHARSVARGAPSPAMRERGPSALRRVRVTSGAREEETMRRKTTGLAGSLVLAIGATVAAGTAPAQPVDTAMIDAGSPNDWLTYHGSYKSYHYSPLDQINTGNVRDLQV